MNTEELNEFIKHYLENDKTKSAILLTAPWGTGKSYYVQNELIQYIDTEEEKKCIIVSLYGIKELFEVSKSIYLDVRARILNSKSEKMNAGKILAKTIFNGVTSFFGIDLSTSQDDLLKLYKSIDLTGKLVILEDLERSGIDILEIMGYVNNLVEQDGVKVLLVANEQELIKYDTVEKTDKNGKTETINVLTKESERYLQIKEKTVSDTIQFVCPLRQAIENIIHSFNNNFFEQFLVEEGNADSSFIEEIISQIMWNRSIQNSNLRSFTFACQKTNDIFCATNASLNIDYLKYIFLSITAFVMKKKQNDNLQWSSTDGYSPELGTYQYPLPRFCYDYVCNHSLDVAALIKTEKFYCAQKELERQKTEARAELEILYDYLHCAETDVLNAISKIAHCLEQNSISQNEYGKLANYLFAVEYVVGKSSDIERCKTAILKNLEGADESVLEHISFHSGIQIDDTEQKMTFEKFKVAMTEVANTKAKLFFDFNYSVENLDEFCKYVYQNNSWFLNNKTFARKLDMEKLMGLLSKCTARQIAEIRGAFLSVYQFANINEFFSQDKDALINLQQNIELLLKNSDKLDKIQKLQLTYFIGNLDAIISKL